MQVCRSGVPDLLDFVVRAQSAVVLQRDRLVKRLSDDRRPEVHFALHAQLALLRHASDLGEE